MAGGVLSGDQIRAMLAGDAPLLSDLGDAASQVQPNGIDLTLAAVHRYDGRGTIGIDNADRVLPGLVEVSPDADGWIDLAPGPYHITYREVVSLPKDLMAFGRPRSSLARSGVAIHTAVWDAGYTGRSTSLLVVTNPAGFRVQIGARVMQLVFVTLDAEAAEGYRGRYQGENLPGRTI